MSYRWPRLVSVGRYCCATSGDDVKTVKLLPPPVRFASQLALDLNVTLSSRRELKGVVLASGSSVGLNCKPVLSRLKIVKKCRALGHFPDRRTIRVNYWRRSIDISR